MSQRIGAFTDLIVDLQSFNLDFNEIQMISHGCFGSCYRAKIPLHNDSQEVDCAIKIITNLTSTSEFKMLMFEIESQSLLKHPAILPVIGYSLPLFGDKYSIISPYMPNGTVDKYFFSSESNISSTKQAIIIFGIAAGMAFVHQNHLIHRDLKPSNILLDSDFHPKITDFALAKYFVEGTEYNVDNETNVGTPLYMAPEMVADELAPITNKVDVYSFAISLYEILSRHRAFIEDKVTQFKLYKLISQGFRPTTDEKLISPIFSDLLSACWNGDPENRPSFIKIVKDFMDRRDEYFNQPDIDKNELNNYIAEATKDLKF